MSPQAISLEELKAENAALENTETEEVEATQPQEVVDTEPEEVAELPIEDVEEGAETDQDQTKVEPVESWMQEEDGASSSVEDIPDAAWKAARVKYRAKLDRKTQEHDSETQSLKDEIARLNANQTPTGVQARPKLEDFDHDVEKYDAAVDEWHSASLGAQMNAHTQTQNTKASMGKAVEQLNKAVDQHYDRAAKMTEQYGISPEVYQQADLSVRQMIETIRPNEGDAITEGLISKLGEGSEKVFYFLGKNEEARAKLQTILSTDPSGLAAAMYLGELKGKHVNPKKKTSNAPAPAAQVKGDTPNVDNMKDVRKRYAAAQKAGNVSDAFNIKRNAKKAGADTTNW